MQARQSIQKTWRGVDSKIGTSRGLFPNFLKILRRLIDISSNIMICTIKFAIQSRRNELKVVGLNIRAPNVRAIWGGDFGTLKMPFPAI